MSDTYRKVLSLVGCILFLDQFDITVCYIQSTMSSKGVIVSLILVIMCIQGGQSKENEE